MNIEVGDLVCAETYIGIVYSIADNKAILNCQDGKQHTFRLEGIVTVAKASQIAGMFEEGILHATT
jgi:hypothetical protein